MCDFSSWGKRPRTPIPFEKLRQVGLTTLNLHQHCSTSRYLPSIHVFDDRNENLVRPLFSPANLSHEITSQRIEIRNTPYERLRIMVHLWLQISLINNPIRKGHRQKY